MITLALASQLVLQLFSLKARHLVTTIPETKDEPPVEHIGSAPHTVRNILVALSLFLMAGLLLKFYWPGADPDPHVSGELVQFRQAMFHRCGGQQFGGGISSQLAQAYAANDRMRVEVIKQFHQLQSSSANCDEVKSALQSVEYPNQ